MNAVQVKIPDELLDSMELLTEVINEHHGTAVVIMGENMNVSTYQKNSHSIIRIYLFKKQRGRYEYSQELEAFSFSSLEGAYGFLEALPHMSALDMLIQMNMKV